VDGGEEADCARAGEEVVRWIFGAETEFDCVALENMDEYMVSDGNVGISSRKGGRERREGGTCCLRSLRKGRDLRWPPEAT